MIIDQRTPRKHVELCPKSLASQAFMFILFIFYITIRLRLMARRPYSRESTKSRLVPNINQTLQQNCPDITIWSWGLVMLEDQLTVWDVQSKDGDPM